jgi:hypothetical protein
MSKMDGLDRKESSKSLATKLFDKKEASDISVGFPLRHKSLFRASFHYCSSISRSTLRLKSSFQKWHAHPRQNRM